MAAKKTQDSREAMWRKHLPALMTTKQGDTVRKPTQAEIDLVVELGLQLDLDPVLGEVVLYKGRPYVTEAGLMKKAISSGLLDGMTVDAEFTDPDGNGDRWIATTTLHKKDCSQPFVFHADQREYENPSSNIWKKNRRSMTEKCCTCKTIRHAFAISICSYEEMAVDEQGVSADESQAAARAAAAESAGESQATATKSEKQTRKEAAKAEAGARLTPEQLKTIGGLYRLLGLSRNGEGGSEALFRKSFPTLGNENRFEQFLTATEAVGYIRDLWAMVADRVIAEFSFEPVEIAAARATVSKAKTGKEMLDEEWAPYVAALKRAGAVKFYEYLNWDDEERAEHFSLHFPDKSGMAECDLVDLDNYISELRAALAGAPASTEGQPTDGTATDQATGKQGSLL